MKNPYTTAPARARWQAEDEADARLRTSRHGVIFRVPACGASVRAGQHLAPAPSAWERSAKAGPTLTTADRPGAFALDGDMRSFKGASNTTVLDHLRTSIKTSTWRQMATATGASLYRLRSLAERNGLLKPPQFDTPEQRFWGSVVRMDGCWGWRGKIDRDGYARFRNPVGTAAHRYSWYLHFGKIPAGLLVCHACDNPPCTNPAHLFLGTDCDNRRDAVSKGRAAAGERHPRTKLSDASVLAIRAEFSGIDRGTTRTQRQLAKAYGVCRGTIQRVLRDTKRASKNVMAP